MQILDVFFASGSKRRFFDITEMRRAADTITLVNWQGAETVLNWGAVNFIEDVTEYGEEKPETSAEDEDETRL